MKHLLCLVALSLTCLALPAAAAPRPVVLELFTSNSCSSCPPAYALLARVAQATPADIELIRLDLHVDYWNQLGWVDQYSEHAFTERQREYAHDVFGANRVYTPQLVVNGRHEMVGSNRPRVEAAIAADDAPPVQPLGVTVRRIGPSAIATVSLGKASYPANAKLWLALTEDDVVSAIGAGENAGRTLSEDGVVRYLQPITTGKIDTQDGQYSSTIRLPVDTSGHVLHVVAFIQLMKDHKIVAAGSQMVPL